MTIGAVRFIGRVRDTTTYKVADDKVENGEAVVIVVRGDGPAMVQCLTCSAYKCEHARAALDHDIAKHIDG